VSNVADAFRRQAESFEALGSPVYARLAERLAVSRSSRSGCSTVM
jgi:hypothetical protein